MKKVISTTNAPAAIGPYSQAIEANGFVFASGQIPVNPETGEIPEGIEAQAEQVMKNVKNLLEAAGTSVDQVVKTSVDFCKPTVRLRAGKNEESSRGSKDILTRL